MVFVPVVLPYKTWDILLVNLGRVNTIIALLTFLHFHEQNIKKSHGSLIFAAKFVRKSRSFPWSCSCQRLRSWTQRSIGAQGGAAEGLLEIGIASLVVGRSSTLVESHEMDGSANVMM